MAFTEPVSPTERVVPFDSLHGRDEVPRITVEVPEIGSVTTRMGKHTYPDTKHREVTYRLRAQTRYQEYFAAELQQLRPMAEAGLLELEPRAIQVSPTGWYVVRAIAMVFDRHLHSDRQRERFSRII